MKGQVNVTNIAGAAISGTLILAAYSVPFPNRFLKATSKIGSLTPELAILENRNSITNTKTSASLAKSLCSPTVEKFTPQNNKKETPQQMPMTEQLREKTKPQASQIPMATQSSNMPQLTDKPQLTGEVEVPSKSKGCPKNSEYYTMKPRPKSPPAECLACENLIKCVCLTSTEFQGAKIFRKRKLS